MSFIFNYLPLTKMLKSECIKQRCQICVFVHHFLKFFIICSFKKAEEMKNFKKPGVTIYRKVNSTNTNALLKFLFREHEEHSSSSRIFVLFFLKGARDESERVKSTMLREPLCTYIYSSIYIKNMAAA